MGTDDGIFTGRHRSGYLLIGGMGTAMGILNGRPRHRIEQVTKVVLAQKWVPYLGGVGT